jgi:hypothetical protein
MEQRISYPYRFAFSLNNALSYPTSNESSIARLCISSPPLMTFHKASKRPPKGQQTLSPCVHYGFLTLPTLLAYYWCKIAW